MNNCVTCKKPFEGSWTGDCPECEQRILAKWATGEKSGQVEPGSQQRAGSGAVGGGGRTRKGYVFGKLIVTTCMQAQGAPLADPCFTTDAEGRRYKGWAILLKPWRRDRHGASEIQPALVVGWRQRQNDSSSPTESA